MTKEDIEFRVYLEENGYDTAQMGILDEVSSVDGGSEKGDLEKQPA